MKTILFYEAGKPNGEGKVGGSYYSLYQLVCALQPSYKCLVLFKYENVTCSWYTNLENVEVFCDIREEKKDLENAAQRNRSGLWVTKPWYRELSAIKKFFNSGKNYHHLFKESRIDIIINNNRITENLDLLRYGILSGAKLIQYQRAYETYYPLFLRWIKLNTVTVSDDVRYSLPLIVRKKSKTVYNWLSKPVRQRKDIALMGKPLRFVWLGRGVGWKGLDILEEIILKSTELRIELDIYLISDSNDSYKRMLKTFYEIKPKNVRLFLNQSQQNIDLRDYNCLLHTSTLPEPFGRVIIEAMSAGLIPITTGIGGPSEIVRHGVNGFITNSKKPKDFITMLTYVQSLSVNRLKEISEESYNNWEINFSGSSLNVLLDVIE